MKAKLSKELRDVLALHKPITFLVFAKSKKQFDSVFNPASRLMVDDFRYVSASIQLEGWRACEPGIGFIYLEGWWKNPVFKNEHFQETYHRLINTI